MNFHFIEDYFFLNRIIQKNRSFSLLKENSAKEKNINQKKENHSIKEEFPFIENYFSQKMKKI